MSAAGLSVFGKTIRISVRAKAHVSNRAFVLEIDVFYLALFVANVNQMVTC